MKILEVAEFYSEEGGGVRTYILQKIESAKAAGHTVTIIAPGEENRVAPLDGGKIIWVKAPRIPLDPRYHLFWDQKPIDEIVAEERPDFIEGSSSWRGGWIAGRQSRAIPKSLVIHQDPVLSYPQAILTGRMAFADIDRMFAWFFRYFRKLQDLYDVSVVSSRWLSNRLASFGMKQPSVVKFGIDAPFFAQAERSAFFRRAMLHDCGVDDPNATLFLIASRHHPEKRLPMLFDAFRAAAREAPMALYVIGDGPSRRLIEAEAAKTPGVLIAGFINDRRKLASIYASTDCYVHACPSETFGMTVAEAMASGAPVIVPAAGAAQDLIAPAFADTFKADDVNDLKAALLRFVGRDRAWRAAASASARQAAPATTEHFKELFALYEQTVEARRAGSNDRSIGDRPPTLQQVA